RRGRASTGRCAIGWPRNRPGPHRIEPVPVRDPGVRCLVMEELERLGHGVLSFINDKRSTLPEPPSGYNARRMEAERINQITSTLTDLQARSAALRRYL